MVDRQLNRLAGNSVIYLAGELLTKGGYFFLIPLYTHYITPTENGIVGVSISIRNLITIVFYTIVVNVVTRFYYSYEGEARRRFLGTLWCGLGILLLGLGFFSEILGSTLFLNTFKHLTYYPYGQLSVWTGLLLVLSDRFGLAILRVQERAWDFVFLSLAGFLAKTGFTIYFVIIKNEQALGALKGELFGAVFMLIPCAILLAKAILLTLSKDSLRKIVIFGGPLIPHALSSWGLALSDRPILERFVSLSDLGVYTLAGQIATIVSLVVSALGNAWSPFFLKNITNPEKQKAVQHSATMFWAMALISGLGVSLLAPPFVALVAAPSYNAAGGLISIMAFGYVLQGFYNVPGNILMFKEKTKLMAVATGLGLITSILLNILLIPHFGALAAAVNIVLAYLVMFLVAMIASDRWKLISYQWTSLLIFSSICFVFYFVASSIAIGSPFLELATRGMVFCAGSLLGVYFLQITKSKRGHTSYQLVSKKKGR